MADNFDVEAIVSRIKGVGEAAAKKGAGLLEIARLKGQILEKKNEISCILSRMGKAVYSVYKGKADEADYSVVIDENCAKIDSIREEIKAKKERISEIKDSICSFTDDELENSYEKGYAASYVDGSDDLYEQD